MKMVVNNNLVNAAKKKYEAQIEEALATLHIYFTNSVGIGEHPDLLTDCLLYTSPSPRDRSSSRMPSSA